MLINHITMKNVALRSLITGKLLLKATVLVAIWMVLTTAVVYAQDVTIGLQDVYLYALFKDLTGQDVTHNVINTGLANADTPICLPGGVAYIPTSAISGRAVDPISGVRDDVTVNFGILQVFENNTTTNLSSAIVSIDRNSSTPLGTDFFVALDFSNVPNISVAELDYLPMHTYSIGSESSDSSNQTFADRLNNGNFAVFKESPGIAPFSSDNLDLTSFVIEVPLEIIQTPDIGSGHSGKPGEDARFLNLNDYIDIRSGISGNTVAQVVSEIVEGLPAKPGSIACLDCFLSLDNMQVDPPKPEPPDPPKDPIVNSLVSLEVVDTSFDPTPVPSGPAGTFTIEAVLTNTSSTPILNLFIQIKELSDGNLLLPDISSLCGIGSTAPDIGTDNILSPGELVPVEFLIGLQDSGPFVFFVDVYGVLME